MVKTIPEQYNTFICKVLESLNFAWIVVLLIHFTRIILVKLLINSNPLVLFVKSFQNYPCKVSTLSLYIFPKSSNLTRFEQI